MENCCPMVVQTKASSNALSVVNTTIVLFLFLYIVFKSTAFQSFSCSAERDLWGRFLVLQPQRFFDVFLVEDYRSIVCPSFCCSVTSRVFVFISTIC